MSTEFPLGAGPASNDPVPMPRPPADGAEPDFTLPDPTLPDAPRTPEPVVVAGPRKKKASKPVAAAARAAASVPKIEIAPEQGPQKQRLPPSSIKGWIWSLAFHGLLLLIIGLWFFSTPPTQQRTFDSRLASSPYGSELGVDLTGGFDDTLKTPAGSLTVLDPAELTKVPPAQVALDPGAIARSALSATSGGGSGGPGTTASGGGGSGFGLARFGSGGETIQGVAVKVGDPQFTLIWDTQADIDIHVLEPGGAEIYWESPNGQLGGELDVDDRGGFGPENVYWVQGKGPPGEYKWFVHYYAGIGGFAGPSPATRWKVRIKHDDKVVVEQGRLASTGARSRTYTMKVDPGGRSGRPDRVEPADVSGWKLFSSPEGAFSVSIPEIPTGRKQTVRTPLGDLEEYRYVLEPAGGSYAVAHLDFPAERMQGKDPLTLLDDSTASLVSAAQGKQDDLRRIALNGQPGREVRFEGSGGSVTVARLYLVNRRLYQVAVTGTGDFASSAEAEAFLRSFHFVAPK
jgi:hypothetical protein